MKQLSERLENYKTMKRAIEQGEVQNGYRVKYDTKTVSFLFRELNGHIVIEQNANHETGKTVEILELEERDSAKKICYKEMFKYLRKNSHVDYNMLWQNRHFPTMANDGTLTVIRTPPDWIFGKPLSKFGLLPEKTRVRVNKRRSELGYANSPLLKNAD